MIAWAAVRANRHVLQAPGLPAGWTGERGREETVTHPLAFAAARANYPEDVIRGANSRGHRADRRCEIARQLASTANGVGAEMRDALAAAGAAASASNVFLHPGARGWLRGRADDLAAAATSLGFDPEAIDVRALRERPNI